MITKDKLTGLVVCGGASSRMGKDKSLLQYHDKAQRYHIADMLSHYCKDVYLSLNEDQYQYDQIIKRTFSGCGNSRCRRDNERIQCIPTRCRCDNTHCRRNNTRCRRDNTRCRCDNTRCRRNNTRCRCNNTHCRRNNTRCRRDNTRCRCDNTRCRRNNTRYRCNNTRCRHNNTRCRRNNTGRTQDVSARSGNSNPLWSRKVHFRGKEMLLKGGKVYTGNQIYRVFSDLPQYSNRGPMAALLTAYHFLPESNLIVIGCDYPLFTKNELEDFISSLKESTNCKAFYNEENGFYEPLLAYYAAPMSHVIKAQFEQGNTSLQFVLKEYRAEQYFPKDKSSMKSADDPVAYEQVKEWIKQNRNGSIY